MEVLSVCKQYNFTNVRELANDTYEIINRPESWLLIVNDDNTVDLKHCNYRVKIGRYHNQKTNITLRHALNHITSHKSMMYENKYRAHNRLDRLFAQIERKK